MVIVIRYLKSDVHVLALQALHVPRRKHRKRLSSTPKLPSPAPFLPHLFLSSHTPPLTTLTTDTSLQDTPLPPPTTKSPGDRIRRKIAKFTESSGSKGEKVSSGVSGTAVPGGLSRKKERERANEVFDVSSDIRNSSVSRVAGESRSIRSRYQSGNKKSRGLTVSFVTDENTQTERTEVKDGDSIGGVGVGSRKGRSQGVWPGEGEKGEALVRSLNSSRFGALEHKREICVCVCVCVFTYMYTYKLCLLFLHKQSNLYLVTMTIHVRIKSNIL